MAKLESTVTWTVYDADKMTQREIYGIVLTDLGRQYPEIVGLSGPILPSPRRSARSAMPIPIGFSIALRNKPVRCRGRIGEGGIDTFCIHLLRVRLGACL